MDILQGVDIVSISSMISCFRSYINNRIMCDRKIGKKIFLGCSYFD